jgi:flagellar motor switch protein FliN/FliY
MSDSQADIDALLAEVNALASEAVGEIAGPRTAVTEGAAASPAVEPRTFAPRTAPANIERVLHLEVPVIVRLAERSMRLSDILNMTSGAIIEFEKPADGELDLLINNKCIGHGLAVKVTENFGLRITRIGSLQERIKAMGG